MQKIQIQQPWKPLHVLGKLLPEVTRLLSCAGPPDDNHQQSSKYTFQAKNDFDMILIEFQRRLSELKIKIVTLCKDDQAKNDFKSVSGGCLNSR